MCKQNGKAKRKSRKDQTPMKQSNTGHEKEENQKISTLINPLPSMSNTLNISRISASVSVSFIRVSIRWRNSLKSMMPFPRREKYKSSSV